MARGPLYWSLRNFGKSALNTPASVRTMLSLMKWPSSVLSASLMSKAGLNTSRKWRIRLSPASLRKALYSSAFSASMPTRFEKVTE